MPAVSTGGPGGRAHPVAWANRYGQARVFGTTFGQPDETFEDPNFMGLLGNGIRRAAAGD